MPQLCLRLWRDESCSCSFDATNEGSAIHSMFEHSIQVFCILDDRADHDFMNLLRDVHTLARVITLSIRGAAPVNQRMYPSFDFPTISDADFLVICRMSKSDFLRLLESLGNPAEFRETKNRVYSGVEGLALVFARLAYPGRLCDMIFKGLGQLSESAVQNHD